jgi:hypothetical protein
MLHFLENHDEQRIASPEFAGDANKGKPMMVLSATISSSPTMIYFAQELGEPASENLGFGSASRTSIYDYGGVPTLQRWANFGAFDGGQSSETEKALRDFYSRLLNFTLKNKAMLGSYREIHSYNRHHTSFYNDKLFSFVRFFEDERLIIVCNFSGYPNNFDLKIPPEVISEWNLGNGVYALKDQLYGKVFKLKVENTGKISIKIEGHESFILGFD